jgi:hypothetical protein
MFLRRSGRRRRRALALGGLLGAAIALTMSVSALAGAAEAPVNVTPPLIGGFRVEGEQLTATQGTWDNGPTSFAFQWERCTDPNDDSTCAAIPGADTPQYTLVEDDVDEHVRVGVVASNDGGPSAEVFSAITNEIQAAVEPTINVPPSIQGAVPPEVDDELTANPGLWNGLPAPTFTFQWWSCNGPDFPADCVAIPGATSQTYTPVAGDLGRLLRVEVTATNVAGDDDAESSATLAVVASTAPVNTAAPAITGTPTVGETLTVNPGSWTGILPLSFTVQWQRCDLQGQNCADIPGATGETYTLTDADEGHRVVAVVTATDAEDKKTLAATDPTGIVGTGPVNTTLPAISGTSRVGQTLNATNGTWEGQNTLTFTRQWQRCNAQGQVCTNIPGATGQSYMVQSLDLGSRIVVVVTARNPAGETTSAASNPTAAVTGVPAGQTVPVGDVSLPNRMVISQVQFLPGVLRSRAPFTARFRVTDTEGHLVSGADVTLIAIPYGRVLPPGVVRTDSQGWATFTLQPTAKFPLRKGFLITFLARATKPGGDLLAGVSTRRAASVRINPNA